MDDSKIHMILDMHQGRPPPYVTKCLSHSDTDDLPHAMDEAEKERREVERRRKYPLGLIFDGCHNFCLEDVRRGIDWPQQRHRKSTWACTSLGKGPESCLSS